MGVGDGDVEGDGEGAGEGRVDGDVQYNPRLIQPFNGMILFEYYSVVLLSTRTRPGLIRGSPVRRDLWRTAC